MYELLKLWLIINECRNTDLRTYSSPLLTRFHFNMTNDSTNKIITNIIPTDIAANMKYITCPYLFQLQNNDPKVGKQYRYNFRNCSWCNSKSISFFSLGDFFNFGKILRVSLIKFQNVHFFYQKFGRDIRFVIGRSANLSDTSVVRPVFLDRELCFVIRRSTLYCVNRFKWDIILKSDSWKLSAFIEILIFNNWKSES